MSLFLQERKYAFRIRGDGIVADHVGEVVYSVQFFSCLVESGCYVVLKFLGHPYDALKSALCGDELLGSDEVASVSHEARSLDSAAGHGSKLSE